MICGQVAYRVRPFRNLPHPVVACTTIITTTTTAVLLDSLCVYACNIFVQVLVLHFTYVPPVAHPVNFTYVPRVAHPVNSKGRGISSTHVHFVFHDRFDKEQGQERRPWCS